MQIVVDRVAQADTMAPSRQQTHRGIQDDRAKSLYTDSQRSIVVVIAGRCDTIAASYKIIINTGLYYYD